MPSVLLINPNTSEASTDLMHTILRGVLPRDIALESATARRGVPMITTEEQMAMAVAEVLAIGRARAPAVSAIIIGAFGNPGLALLRAAVSVPVIGIGEAAMREAAAGGRRFGVATTTPGLDEAIARAATDFGLGAQYTGTRVPPGADPLALARDPAVQEATLAGLVHDCITDGAQAVVIGGGPLAAAALRLGPRFQIPVVNPVVAAGRVVQQVLAKAAMS